MSYFLFIPLRPFFSGALSKRWKVQFRQEFAYFNNVDSKTTYIYICIFDKDLHIFTKLIKKQCILMRTAVL